jgi:hypothetical protein
MCCIYKHTFVLIFKFICISYFQRFIIFLCQCKKVGRKFPDFHYEWRGKVSFLTFISRTYKKLNNTLQYLPNKLSLCIRLDHKANYVEFIQVSLSCVRVAHCQTTSLFYMCVCLDLW